MSIDFQGKQYDKRLLLKYLGVMLLTMVLGKATVGFAAILIPILVIVAIMRDQPVALMFWTMMMTFFSMANRNLFANNAVSILTARVTLILMAGMLAGKLISDGKAAARLVTPFWGLLVYVFWECIVSAQGWQPTISYLKLTLFFVIYLALIGMANQVNRSTRANAKRLRSAVLAFLCVAIFGSIVLLPFGIGMMSGEDAMEAIKAGEMVSLFMGMTCHSQVLGPFAAILGTFIFADLVFSIKKWDRLYVALLLCCPLLIYRTSSRTGMGTLFAGCGMVLLLALQAKGLGSRWKGKMLNAMMALAVLGGIGMVAVPAVRERVAQYVLKYGKDTKSMTMDDILKSRQSKLDEMFLHIKQKPLLGNGFQVSEEMAYQKRSGFVSYLSAPVEKGTWIFAIVEEGGAVGMLFFCVWLLVVFALLIKRHAYIGISVFFALLTANLGEFSIFSMSYSGGFFWAFVFVGICFDVQRMKGSSMPVFFVPIEQVREEVGYDAWERPLG